MTWNQSKFEASAKGPLHGLRIVDLSRLVAGNMASLQLADHGADVIKIEPLPKGDPLRAWGAGEVPTFWKTYCRNKRSVALDFRSAGGIDLLRRVIGSADVLIENFRPGTMEKMGLDPDDLMAANEGLVILRISGFGQTGPYGARPAFGTLIEAMSGFASRNGEEGGDPLLPPLALADMIAGLYGAFGVMTALHARKETGQGQVVDLSLLESMVSVLGPEPLDLRLQGKPKLRLGNGSSTASPRNVYRTGDDQFIALSASIQQVAERVFRLIGRPDMLDDPRFATNSARVRNRVEVDAALSEWVGARSRDEALSEFSRAGVTAAPIYDSRDIVADPHFQEREIFIEMPDEDLDSIPMHHPIPRLGQTPGSLRFAAPRLGQHTRDVLAEVGMGKDEINVLIAENVVRGDAND